MPITIHKTILRCDFPEHMQHLEKRWLFTYYILLDIFFIYISNVIPFPCFPSENPLLPPLPPYSLTYPLLIPGLATLGHRASTGPRASLPIDEQQGHSLYICSWRLESHHVYSLVGGLVPGSSEGTVGSYCSSYGSVDPFSSLGPFSSSSNRDPMLSPMVG